MRTPDLLSEVILIDETNTATSTSSPFHDPDEARALSTSFQGGNNGCGRGGYRGSYQASRGRGGMWKRPSTEPVTYCEGCKLQGHIVENCPKHCSFCWEHGHLIDNCFKQKWANEQRFSKRNKEKEDYRSSHEYRPSFDSPFKN